MFYWTVYPQTYENRRQVLRGGLWKDVVVRGPVWQTARKDEEEVEEDEAEEMKRLNRQWRADENRTMVPLRGIKDIY